MEDRIIHVPRRFLAAEWGGTEMALLNLCALQQQAGYRPEIHTSKALDPRTHESFQGIPVHRYSYFYPLLGADASERRRLDLKAGNLVSLSLFRRLLALRNVRLYHAHALGRLGGEVLTAARLRRRPCVVTLHGGCFDVPPEERVASLPSSSLDWGKVFGLLFSSRKLLQSADAIICVGHGEFEAAQEALGPERVHLLPGGVDPSAFQNGDRVGTRRRLGFDSSLFVFGCISRIDPQKDQLCLLKAFEEVYARNPRARLVLAGPISVPSYGAGLRDEIGQRGLENVVCWLPAVEGGSRGHADLLAALDVFVLPSRHEPFGIVALEAWAAGLPLIASRIGGLAQLVEHDVDGLHFEPRSAADLAQQMARLHDASEKRESLGFRGQQKAQDYSWSVASRRLEAIYQSAEDRFPGRRSAA